MYINIVLNRSRLVKITDSKYKAIAILGLVRSSFIEELIPCYRYNAVKWNFITRISECAKTLRKRLIQTSNWNIVYETKYLSLMDKLNRILQESI